MVSRDVQEKEKKMRLELYNRTRTVREKICDGLVINRVSATISVIEI